MQPKYALVCRCQKCESVVAVKYSNTLPICALEFIIEDGEPTPPHAEYLPTNTVIGLYVVDESKPPEEWKLLDEPAMSYTEEVE